MKSTENYPVITAVSRPGPAGAKITEAILEFAEVPQELKPETITVEGRTVTGVKTEGKTVTVFLSEEDENAAILPPMGGPKGKNDPGEEHPPVKRKGPGPGEPGFHPDIPERIPRHVQLRADIPGIGIVASSHSKAVVMDDFTEGTYGRILYELYKPAAEKNGERYPLVMFIPDASANSSNPAMVLLQGTVWAEKAEQQKRPCYVLAIQIPHDVVLTNDSHECSDELNDIKELLDKVICENSVDPDRIYATGQSQGCMAVCELNIRYPDLFAASLLVSGHWDVRRMMPLSDHRFFFALDEGGRGEFPNFNAITDGYLEQGVDVRRVWLNYRDGWEINNQKIRALGTDARMIHMIFHKETAFPDDGVIRPEIMHHNRGWELTYQMESVREWLFAQRRSKDSST